MIKYVKGDLFKLVKLNSNIIIPHVCNDKGRWGSGFVVAVSKMFPMEQLKDSPEFMYRNWCSIKDICWANQFKLGNVQFVETESGVWVVNMIAQHGTVSKDNPKPIRYTALVECMLKVAAGCGDQQEIHAPMFGSALAGGDWNVIEALIEEIWCDNHIPVTIYWL